jgi:hypothetical protein
MSLEDMELKIQKWNRFNVLGVKEKINNRLTEERDSLNTELKKSTDSFRSMDGFKKLTIQEDLISKPIDLLIAKQSPLIYLFVIVFQCLLLLPYWLTTKPIYNTSKKSKNEGDRLSVDL